MNQKVIEIKNLSFAISAKMILENISFSVSSGQKLYVVGPNGAGKTTLLRCISRILTGFGGAIRIKNKKLSDYSQKNLAKILTYVPQSLGSDIPFTVHQFVLMARYPHLSPFSVVKPDDEKIVRQAMETTGTDCFAERIISTLSGGERQQVSIAAAVAQKAEIFLLDEPATYLDYAHQRDIQKLLAKINKTFGTTIVCVTHDLNSAALNADSIIALKEGRIVFDGMAAEIMNDQMLEKIYGKKFDFVCHPQT
ncbi:MAG: ABC transporter ATP-binding protein, partial [Phycisphaerae bacterium]|nr:ABC transporter ATP-binding protein [Phycisphaerae bacterium]